MRTEQQLRTALYDVADLARPTEDLYATILRQTTRRRSRRRRTVLLVAVVAAALVAALVIPTFLTQRTVVPADQRVPGNWNPIHRVDLPAGWVVRTVTVMADAENSNIGLVNADPQDMTGGCLIAVYGPASHDPREGKTKHRPVVVNGTPATYVEPGPDTQGGVFWPYQPDAWAQVSCEAGEAESLDIAGRVHFGATKTRLPFRLRALPDGYRVLAVHPQPEPGSRTLGAVALTPTDPVSTSPHLTVVASPGRTEVPPGLAGWETDTIAGLPAVLSARDASLCLNPPGHTLCIDSSDDSPADLTQSLWPAERRELLVEVAENLTLAKRLDNPATWFDTPRALPK